MSQIKKGKGGPPTEEWNDGDCESPGDLDSKAVDIQRFNDNWVRYLKWEVWTKSRLYDVAIFERDEEDDEAGQGSEGEEEEEEESDDSESDDVAGEKSIAGGEGSSNKRAAADDLDPEDSTKRARLE